MRKIIKAETFWADSQFISLLQISEMPTYSTFLTVEVEGPTHRFVKRKPVYIRKAESLVFAQTDKPIYKPGQKGIRAK